MKKVILLITLIVALFLGACETEGGNKVEELITEEELIEYIQTPIIFLLMVKECIYTLHKQNILMSLM